MKQSLYVKASAAAVLFSMLALPASAHGNGQGAQGKFSFNFGGLKAIEKMLAKDSRKSENESRKSEKKAEKQADSACLAAAKFTRADAIDAAADVREAAQFAAVQSYFTSMQSAFSVRASARASARATFLASAKDAAAKTVYANAKLTADTNWAAAKTTAQNALNAARAASDATFKTAKAAADAALATAKAACATQAPAPVTPTDTVAPSTVTTLALSNPTSSSMVVTWTAPGDDAAVGTATSYDLRRSTTPIVTDADWNAAAQVAGEPVPAAAGATQSITITGLNAATSYYFALKASDEAGNVSALSNVPVLATMAQ